MSYNTPTKSLNPSGSGAHQNPPESNAPEHNHVTDTEQSTIEPSIELAIKQAQQAIDTLKALPKINNKLPDNAILAIGKLNGAIIKLG